MSFAFDIMDCNLDEFERCEGTRARGVVILDNGFMLLVERAVRGASAPGDRTHAGGGCGWRGGHAVHARRQTL